MTWCNKLQVLTVQLSGNQMNLAACWLSVHRTHHTLLWGDDWLVVMVTAAVAAGCSRAVMLTGWPPNSWTTRADVDTLGRPGAAILSYLSHHCQSRHTRAWPRCQSQLPMCSCHLSSLTDDFHQQANRHLHRSADQPTDWLTDRLTTWPTDWDVC